MRCISIGHNEFLVYDNEVAGLFSDFRSTANLGVHMVENRRLSDKEIEQLLNAIRKVNVEIEPCEDDFEVLKKIAYYYPEAKYFVHGLGVANVALAASPKRLARKRQNLLDKRQKKLDKQNKQKAEEEKLKSAPATEETKVEDKPTAPKEDVKVEDKPEPKPTTPASPAPATDKNKEQKLKQLTEKAQKEIDRRDSVKKAEDKIKKPEKFSGFKGMLFDFFKGLPSPKIQREKAQMKREIREEWKKYKMNENLFKQNEGLIDSLKDQLEKGEMNTQSISLMNTLLSKDHAWVKELDFDIKEPDLSLPLDKLVDHLDLKTNEISVSDLEAGLRKLLKDNKIDTKKFKLDLANNALDIATDWNSGMKALNAFNIKAKDLKKRIS
jgi:hypothetical protein